jgi:hypothetical protein
LAEFFVAFLCFGALAGGAPLFWNITGIIGGVVVGLLVDLPRVSGPAAGLAVYSF